MLAAHIRTVIPHVLLLTLLLPALATDVVAQTRDRQATIRPVPIAPAPPPVPAPAPSARGPAVPRTLSFVPPLPCGLLHVDAASERGQRDGSVGFPFASINAAIASATARHCPLDIALAAGSYQENINVETDLSIKGAGREVSLIQGTLRAVGDHHTVLWDLGFVHSSAKALYKEGGAIELQRVGATDVKFTDTATYASPGAVQIVNASGVVNGLVADDNSSPALLVEGAASRIKSFGLVITHSTPAVPVTNDLRSVAAVEVRDGAAVMGMLWQITDNYVFGIAVTTGASLFLDHGEVNHTTQAAGNIGPDNLLVASHGILEIDHVTSSGAGRAGALSASGFFVAHRSRLQSNVYGLVNQSSGLYPDPSAAMRCGTADDVVIEGNSKQGVVSAGDLAVPNAPLCVPGSPCPEAPPADLSVCAKALRW